MSSLPPGCSAKEPLICEECVKNNQQHCSRICSGEHVPFPAAMKAVCNTPAAAAPTLGSAWHGGQWLIPEVQNDTTGIVCDWGKDLDLKYIDAAVKASEVNPRTHACPLKSGNGLYCMAVLHGPQPSSAVLSMQRPAMQR